MLPAVPCNTVTPSAVLAQRSQKARRETESSLFWRFMALLI
jgi:hypothetical protein